MHFSKKKGRIDSRTFSCRKIAIVRPYRDPQMRTRLRPARRLHFCYNRRMKSNLPETFRPILWSYDFDRLDPVRNQKTIIIQAINYGTLAHWRWLTERYGRDGVRQVLSVVPATEIKPRARRLAALMFGVDQFNYAPRSSY